MRNYFETQRINWVKYDPSHIIFKSNNLVKKLLPQENALSYKSKSHRDDQMRKNMGGTKYSNGNNIWYSQDTYKSVHVHLKDLKTEFPTADLEFIDRTPRNDSAGQPVPHVNALVYITSLHRGWDWVRDPNTGDYSKVSKPNVCGVDEGYYIAYGGQGEDNGMKFHEFRELLDISEAVKNFLVEVVVPFKNGTLEQNHLLVA
tara:strand:+ start:3787 stop:4392 length:606 start_codon:yes stop_codon:yes gene_type:complete